MALTLAYPSPPTPPADADRKITLMLPEVVVRELKQRMAAEDTTMRVLVLAALAEAGYHVPKGALRDRRRR